MSGPAEKPDACKKRLSLAKVASRRVWPLYWRHHWESWST